MFDQFDDVAIIETETRNGIVRFRDGGFFLKIDRMPVTIEFDHSIPGELEITHLNQLYLDVQSTLITGTHESVLETSQFISTIERGQSEQMD